MKSILETLNKDAGLLGSMVMTPDGMPVAASLAPSVEPEATAALASSLILALGNAARGFGFQDALSACYLNSTQGKALLINLENSYLVVVARPETAVAADDEAVRSAIQRIKNRKVA